MPTFAAGLLSGYPNPPNHEVVNKLERAEGIEPSPPILEDGALPLSYARTQASVISMHQTKVYIAHCGYGERLLSVTAAIGHSSTFGLYDEPLLSGPAAVAISRALPHHTHN